MLEFGLSLATKVINPIPRGLWYTTYSMHYNGSRSANFRSRPLIFFQMKIALAFGVIKIQFQRETRLGCFDITAILSWGWLKLRLSEVKDNWSWGYLKLRLIEVKVEWSWGSLKLRFIEVEVDCSWGWLKLRLIEVKVNLHYKL